jgi:CDP-4-dehydro-6-deoxyglucose reductase
VIDGQNFARLQRREPRFRFIRTLTGEAGLPPRGRIPATLATLVGDLADHDVFVAGAPDFVIACAAAAEALGTTRARLQIEAF